MRQTLNKQELRRLGMAALREKLGVVGFIEFLQDLGINHGDYTEERKRLFANKTVEEIIKEMDQSSPPSAASS